MKRNGLQARSFKCDSGKRKFHITLFLGTIVRSKLKMKQADVNILFPSQNTPFSMHCQPTHHNLGLRPASASA